MLWPKDEFKSFEWHENVRKFALIHFRNPFPNCFGHAHFMSFIWYIYTYLFTKLVSGAVGIRYYQIQYFSDIFLDFDISWISRSMMKLHFRCSCIYSTYYYWNSAFVACILILGFALHTPNIDRAWGSTTFHSEK